MAEILSQSEIKALNPAPSMLPAVLEKEIRDKINSTIRQTLGKKRRARRGLEKGYNCMN